MFSSAPVDTSSLSVEQPHSFQINFNSLYTALCEQQRSDQATLLLYTLLHQNTNMRTYMLSRTDMDNLVGGTAVKTAAHPLFLSQSDVLSVVFWQNKSKKKQKLLRMNQSVIPQPNIIFIPCTHGNGAESLSARANAMAR